MKGSIRLISGQLMPAGEKHFGMKICSSGENKRGETNRLVMVRAILLRPCTAGISVAAVQSTLRLWESWAAAMQSWAEAPNNEK